MQSSSERALWESLRPELETLGYRVVDCHAVTLNSILLKARQVLVERDVAIKILRNVVQEQDLAYRRFEQEVKLLAGFSQENIVKLYGAGRLQDGRLYMIMEFIDGSSLAEILERDGALPESRLLPYVAQICDALEYAHSQNIVHRDLKPANIMVQTIENDEIVKLVDLGIHKSIAGGDQKLTATGAVMPGTKNYMSPEQCRGEALDARSDIYSLGCVLYELLVGQAPMEAETDYAILFNHLNKAITTVPSKFPLSSRFKSIVLRCLEKDKNKRWNKVSEIKSELQKCKPLSNRRVRKSTIGKSFALMIILVLSAFFCYLMWKEKRMSALMGESKFSTDAKRKPEEFSNLEDRLARLEKIDIANTVAKSEDVSSAMKQVSDIVVGIPSQLSLQDQRAQTVLADLLGKVRKRFNATKLASSNLSEKDKACVYSVEAELELRMGLTKDFEQSFINMRNLGDAGRIWLGPCLEQACSRSALLKMRLNHRDCLIVFTVRISPTSV
jgi:serine/threonine protein kinase